jgi:RHS repeat-associated protein
VFGRIDFASGEPQLQEWLLTDHLGSIRDVVNASGTVVDQLSYDAFGNILTQTAPSETGLYSYAGMEYDANTGLYSDRARYYNPQTQQWLSQDPMGFGAGDSNLYRYVNNDPLNAIDPSGQALFVEGEPAVEWLQASLKENYKITTKYYDLGTLGKWPLYYVWTDSKSLSKDAWANAMSRNNDSTTNIFNGLYYVRSNYLLTSGDDGFSCNAFDAQTELNPRQRQAAYILNYKWIETLPAYKDRALELASLGVHPNVGKNGAWDFVPGAQPTLRSEPAMGGADITRALKNAMTHVDVDYNKLTTKEKQLLATRLFYAPEALGAWDIQELVSNGPQENRIVRGNETKDTATVNGKVYYTACINYILWGRICRLLHNDNIRFQSRVTLNYLSIDEARAIKTAENWRTIKNAFDGYGVESALSWVRVGWNWTGGFSMATGALPLLPNSREYLLNLDVILGSVDNLVPGHINRTGMIGFHVDAKDLYGNDSPLLQGRR